MSQVDTKNPNPNAGNDGAKGDAKNDKPKKDFFLVRGWRWAKGKVSDAVEVVKDHPVVVALTALGGTAVGGYVGYKIGTSIGAQSAAEPQQPVGMIEGPTEEDEEEPSTEKVEYVDIPVKVEEAE